MGRRCGARGRVGGVRIEPSGRVGVLKADILVWALWAVEGLDPSMWSKMCDEIYSREWAGLQAERLSCVRN